MKNQGTQIWFDLTQALTYPAVLGAMIYYVFNSLLNIASRMLDARLVPPGAPQGHLLEALGFSYPLGIILYLVITLLLVTHYSLDYLYSKYSESYYGFRNFVFDLLISLVLAFGFITFSNNASEPFDTLLSACTVFWLCIAVTYLIFLIWDIMAHNLFRGKDTKLGAFFHKNFRWVCLFDISGLVAFAGLGAALLLAKERSEFGSLLVIPGAAALGLFSIWYVHQVLELEASTKE